MTKLYISKSLDSLAKNMSRIFRPTMIKMNRLVRPYSKHISNQTAAEKQTELV